MIVREYRGWWFYAKRILAALGIFLLFLAIYFLFRLGIINIGITVNDEDANIVFSLLNGLIMGMYSTSLGYSMGASKLWQKAIMISIIAIYVYLGFTFIGFKICSNLPFLIEHCYETNTVQGIHFFTTNLLVFTIIFGLTLITEGEKTNE